MQKVKIITTIVLVAFVGIQFVPTKRNQANTITATDFMQVNDVPKNIEEMLKTSCYDCHSNNTNYPWYNRIQPVTWFLEDHIKAGKSELNFSEWDSLSKRRKSSKLRSVIKQIESNKMPLESYTFIHRNAMFSEKEKQEIINYMTQLKNNF